MRNPIRAVVAVQDLPKGTILNKADVKLAFVPQAYLPNGSIRNTERVIGKEVEALILADEPIVGARINNDNARRASMAIRPGRVALAVEVDEVAGVAGGIRSGDHVDLLCTSTGSGRTKRLFEKVRVLGVGGIAPFGTNDGSGEQGTNGSLVAGTIVLELRPDEAKEVTEEAENGRIRLTLRAAR